MLSPAQSRPPVPEFWQEATYGQIRRQPPSMRALKIFRFVSAMNWSRACVGNGGSSTGVSDGRQEKQVSLQILASPRHTDVILTPVRKELTAGNSTDKPQPRSCTWR
jgi:hypothetical protein